MPYTVKYTLEELDFIKNNMHTLTCKKLGGVLNRHPQGVRAAIKKYLKTNKSTFTGEREKVKFNHDYKILTNGSLESAYWLGFIAADGSITKKQGNITQRLSVGTATQDRPHLEAFAKYISFTGAITTHKTANFSSLCFRLSEEELEYLYNLNIVPCKSLVLKPPTMVSVKTELAYIKGYIDGDGCIKYKGKNKDLPNINILGTVAILEWIKDVLNSSHKIRKKNNIHSIDICGSTARNVVSIMKTLSTPCLERKWRFNSTHQP